MARTLTPPTTEGAPGPDASWKEGDVLIMTELWSRLEKHEAECTLRYQRINEKLVEQKISMKALDLKIWGLAGLIIIAPLVHKLLG
jgi:hypothetical protein